MPALEARDVSMRRCGRSLVQRVSLTADRGELLALCGPDGIGHPDACCTCCPGTSCPTRATVLVDGRGAAPAATSGQSRPASARVRARRGRRGARRAG